MLSCFYRGRYVLFTFLLSILFSAGPGFGFTYTIELTPDEGDFTEAIYNSDTWDYSIAEAAASASAESGAFTLYAAAFCRSADSWVKIYVPFTVPDYSTIRMTPEVTHISEINDMALADAMVTWSIDVDGCDWRGFDFKSASKTDQAMDVVINVISTLLGLFCPPAEIALMVASGIGSAAQVAVTMYQHGGDNVETTTRTFEFTVGPGDHTIGIGLKAHAAAAVAGTGYVVFFGQLEKVTLEITNDYDGYPDLVPSGVATGENEWQRGEESQILVTIANVGEAPGYDDRFSVKMLSLAKEITNIWWTIPAGL